jgi:hypothetical protein
MEGEIALRHRIFQDAVEIFLDDNVGSTRLRIFDPDGLAVGLVDRCFSSGYRGIVTSIHGLYQRDQAQASIYRITP